MKLVSHERKTSGASDDWETPDFLFEKINRVFRFDLDVCATIENRKVPRFFGPGSSLAEDALNTDWCAYGERAWCNPPYVLWPDFVRLAAEYAPGGLTTVVLVPPRTDTISFHKFVPLASEIIFLQGRVSFVQDGEEKSGNGAGSALYIFRPSLPGLQRGGPSIGFWDWKNSE